MTQSVVCVSDVCFAQSCYTGKERDTESGNDYFGARYYSLSMGARYEGVWPTSVPPHARVAHISLLRCGFAGCQSGADDARA